MTEAAARREGRAILALLVGLVALGVVSGALTAWLVKSSRNQAYLRRQEILEREAKVERIKSTLQGRFDAFRTALLDHFAGVRNALPRDELKAWRDAIDAGAERLGSERVAGLLQRISGIAVDYGSLMEAVGGWRTEHLRLEAANLEGGVLERVRDLITELRHAVARLTGIALLDRVSRLLRFRDAREADDVEVQQALALELAEKGIAATDFTLADVEETLREIDTLSERLAGEENPDNLDDLKDNKLVPALDRLERLMEALSHDTLVAHNLPVQRAVDLREAIFGKGSRAEPRGETVTVHDGGLFVQRRDQLNQRAVRERLLDRRATLDERLEAARRDFGNEVQESARGLAEDVAGSATARSGQVLALTVSWNVMLVALALVIGRRVARQVDALRRARLAAQEASRLKSEFLATMSHEIRTPMNGVVGMTSLMLDTRLTQEQREYAETIESSAQSLLALLNEILDLSKIEAGKLQLESISFDPRTVIEEVMSLFAAAAHERHLELATVFEDDPPARFRGDPLRLRQVLVNLLGNAVKFTDRGHIVVRVRCASEDEERVRFEVAVEDTGKGIPRSALDHIFEPFTQADGGTTRERGGTGLGLTISQRLAAMMHGSIAVASVVGRGSTFTLVARFDHDPDAPSRLPPVVGVRRALVVEPHPATRRHLELELGRLGVAVESAENEAAAAAAVAREGDPFDVVLARLHSQAVAGDASPRALRAGRATGARLIAVLASRASGVSEQAAKAGFDGVLFSPPPRWKIAEAIGEPRRERERSEGERPALPREERARILVAEDNAVNLKVAVALLKNLGYRCDTATNGREALEAARRGDYDLVLMDCHMPEMDGYQAAKRIREEDPERRTRIVALTANAAAADRERCLAAGMDDFISKPIALEDLRAHLGRWLADPPRR